MDINKKVYKVEELAFPTSGMERDKEFKENRIVFSRPLSKEEKNTLLNMIDEGYKKLRAWEGVRNKSHLLEEDKTMEDYLKSRKKIMDYVKSRDNLEYAITKKEIPVKEKKFFLNDPKTQKLLKARGKQGMIFASGADGDYGGQSDEYMMLTGSFSQYDIEKIKGFRNKMADLDRMMNSDAENPDEHAITDMKGLAQQYWELQQNLVGYVRLNTKATIQNVPHKDMKKMMNKEVKLEKAEALGIAKEAVKESPGKYYQKAAENQQKQKKQKIEKKIRREKFIQDIAPNHKTKEKSKGRERELIREYNE